MIFFKIDVLKTLKNAGYDYKKIKETHLLSQSTITAIKNDRPITTVTIDRLCTVLKCQPSDLIGYKEVDNDNMIE